MSASPSTQRHRMSHPQPAPNEAPSTRQEELRSFLFFTVVMAPALAVLLVASYGFAVWMYQLVAGPPGV
jgi:nitrate reductase NapE